MATKTVCKRLLQSKLFQTEQMVPPRVPNCTLLIIRITSLLSVGLGIIFPVVHHLFDDTQPHCNVFQYAHGLGGELDRCQQYHLYRLTYFSDKLFHRPSRIKRKTSSPISHKLYTSAFSFANALPLSVPVPSPVSVVTGAMQPSSSFRALLAAWIKIASRPRTAGMPICSPCLVYFRFSSL